MREESSSQNVTQSIIINTKGFTMLTVLQSHVYLCVGGTKHGKDASPPPPCCLCVDAMCYKVCQLGSHPSYCRESLGTGEVLYYDTK